MQKNVSQLKKKLIKNVPYSYHALTMISRPPQMFKSQIDDLIYKVWSVSISQNKYVLWQTFAQANLQAVTNYMLISYFPLTLHQPSYIYGFWKNHKYSIMKISEFLFLFLRTNMSATSYINILKPENRQYLS